MAGGSGRKSGEGLGVGRRGRSWHRARIPWCCARLSDLAVREGHGNISELKSGDVGRQRRVGQTIAVSEPWGSRRRLLEEGDEEGERRDVCRKFGR